MIKLENISKKYRGKISKVIFKDANLHIEKKGIYCIKGKSGIGKSTLLRIISGIENADSGKIFFNNKEIKSTNEFLKLRKNRIGILSQNHNYPMEYSIEYYFESLGRILKTKIEYKRIIALFNKDKILSKKYDDLSAGEKRIIEIAGAFLIDSKDVIILDEPFSNLDSNNSLVLSELLKLESKDKTIIIVSHEEENLNDIVDFYIEINDRKIRVVKNNKNILNAEYDKQVTKEKKDSYKFSKIKKKFSLMRFLFCLNFIVALLLNLSFSKIKLEPVETLNGEEIISVDSNYDSKNVRSIIRDSIYEVVEKNNLKINASKFRNLDIKFKNKEISLDLQRIVSLENHNDLRPVFGEITNDMNEIYVDITIFNKYKQKLSLLGIHKPADLLGIELSDKYYKSNYKVGAIVDTGSQIIFQTESNFYEDTRISINLEGGIEASIINDNYAVNLNPNEAIVSEKFLKSNNHKVGDSLKIIVSKNKTYIFKIYDVSNDINSDIMIKNEEAYKIMYKMVPNYLKGKYYIYILNDNVENINDEDNIYYEVISNNKHINTENKDRIESIEMFRIIIAIFLFLQLVAIIIKEFLVINNKKYKFQVFFLLGIGIRESLMNEILETKKENLTILLSIIAGIWIYFIVTLSPLKNILYFYSPFILGILSGIVLILLNILIKISSIFFVRNRNK